MDKRAVELIERGVAALEKLADEPELEIPTSPPICPNCAKFDPTIVLLDDNKQGSGKLSKIFLTVQCVACSYMWFAIPQGWVNFTTKPELREFFERADNGAHGSETN